MKFWINRKRIEIAVQVLAAVAIAFLLSNFPFYYFESALYDLRVRLSPRPKEAPQVATVLIDRKSVDSFGRQPETLEFSNLLSEVLEEQPAAVVFMQDPTKWKGSDQDKLNFAKIAQGFEKFFFGLDDVVPLSQQASLALPSPFENLKQKEFPTTRDQNSLAQDKVSRRILLSFEGRPTLQMSLASEFNGMTKPEQYRGHFVFRDIGQTYIRYFDDTAIAKYSFIDVANGRFPKNSFTGKIVLIGNGGGLEQDDYSPTPLSRSSLAMPKIEIMAHSVATLIQNNSPVKAPQIYSFLLTLLISFLTIFAVWNLRPLTCIAALGLTALAIGLFGWALFAAAGIWIDLAHPLIAIFVCYYFLIPYRLILENRKGWEYYQKNKLLTQVEELKTNFLSMMSHDLKTPIARIQGMAETALAEKEKLSNSQKHALKSIVQSSEELGAFVSSILDLGRIESKEVKLHKTSKDVNALVKDVLRKYEFAAKAKDISLKSELEPLFSLSIDVDLVRQIISNLVENAIKYSPEGSVVQISTKEIDGKVRIQVADTGAGISPDELENIFLKFYRSKTAKASPIKGSGLGLYLAKYFVELHGGDIQVDSRLNEGTTFSVNLPI